MTELNSNLISGVVSDDSSDSFSLPSQPAADFAEPEPQPAPECRAVPVEFIKDIVDKAVDRFADEMRRAEERGYAKAMDESRAARLDLGDRDKCCPNFLADVRADIWSPEACNNNK